MNNQLALPDEYAPILAKIDEALPLARLDAQHFNKSSSQFKTAILDVIDLTPINSAKHLLAIIQNTRRALEEASIKLRRKKLELKTKELDLLASGNLDKDSLTIDIDELKIEIADIIQSAINSWLPYINIEKLDIKTASDDITMGNSTEITLTFSVQNFQTQTISIGITDNKVIVS